jgi:PleD family two-component response regulator
MSFVRDSSGRLRHDPGERISAEKSLRETDLGNNVGSNLMSGPFQTDAPVFEAIASPNEMVRSAALSILVVEPALDELVRTVAALSDAGFHVTAAERFAQAKHLLNPRSPSVLLTSLRLGCYNGLHLVVRGKALQSQLAAIVTSFEADAVLQSDAEALGATFVLKPITTDQLIASILKTYFRRRDDDAPIRPPFERRVGERRAPRPLESLSIDRRGSDRRRPLPWLVPPGQHSS